KEDGATITVDNYEIMITIKPKKVITLAEVQSQLSEFANDLSIALEAEGIVVRPVGFLGREKFSAIAEKIRGMGGTYISAGKESRFIITEKTSH
ncbi:hypothetical protein GTO27_03830, partial [Candidatus Bathyarchaeota archaeon]|nr:hypothetical protein [Candidatus Bathyarchaeota archaeon]